MCSLIHSIPTHCSLVESNSTPLQACMFEHAPIPLFILTHQCTLAYRVNYYSYTAIVSCTILDWKQKTHGLSYYFCDISILPPTERRKVKHKQIYDTSLLGSSVLREGRRLGEAVSWPLSPTLLEQLKRAATRRAAHTRAGRAGSGESAFALLWSG